MVGAGTRVRVIGWLGLEPGWVRGWLGGSAVECMEIDRRDSRV